MAFCLNCHSNLSTDPELYRPPKPASPLLNTNNAPDPLEAVRIRDLISQASSTIQCLTSNIEQVRQILQEYEKARDDCQDFVAAHQRLLSPVHAIPSEIWSEILAWRQTEQDLTTLSGPFLQAGPLQISSYGAVCSLWRNSTLNMPCLWSTIALIPLLPRNYYELLDVWLQRSKQYPLSIMILGREKGLDDTTYKPFFRCVRLLLQHGSRWQKLRLEMPAPSHEDYNYMSHWPYAIDNAPLLETCSLQIEDWDAPIISRADNLKTVELSIRNSEIGLPLLVPWPSVKKLTLGHDCNTFYRAFEQAEYLDACSSLEELALRNDMSEVDPLVLQVTHRTLKRLTIYGGRAALLSGMTAPALEHLELSCSETEDDRLNTLSFIRRSPSLQSLCLIGQYDIIQGLFYASHIHKLHLAGSYGDAGGIANAMTSLLDPTILPEVQTLVIDIDLEYTGSMRYGSQIVQYESLRNVIIQICEIRLRVQYSPLQRVSVEVYDSSKAAACRKEVEFLSFLKNIGEMGLDVKIGGISQKTR